ncbi:Uncharacterised protein [Mycobacteroides abscessus subsp. abscessus]|nr:Uncharacterised protein [Mycobacteroides abscessus subsp. abscessus]
MPPIPRKVAGNRSTTRRCAAAIRGLGRRLAGRAPLRIDTRPRPRHCRRSPHTQRQVGRSGGRRDPVVPMSNVHPFRPACRRSAPPASAADAVRPRGCGFSHSAVSNWRWSARVPACQRTRKKWRDALRRNAGGVPGRTDRAPVPAVRQRLPRRRETRVRRPSAAHSSTDLRSVYTRRQHDDVVERRRQQHSILGAVALGGHAGLHV